MNELTLQDSRLARPEDFEDDRHPNLWNASAAFFFRALPVEQDLAPPEYVHVPIPSRACRRAGEDVLRLRVAINEWNMAWEVGSERPVFFEEHVPPELRWLAAHEGRNIALLENDGVGVRHSAYEPLYHLLPRRVLERFGLPLLRRGQWPYMSDFDRVSELLPSDYETRLSSALATHLWPLLGMRGGVVAFSRNDPIKLLAHDLDFWRPHIDCVIQQRLRDFPRVAVTDADEQRMLDELRRFPHPPGIVPSKPLKGGDVWAGEADAWDAATELVEIADARGRLRAVLDAVKSHRIEDDFSDRWSWAKEDLERRLFRKRSKTKVSLVELDDTIPVHGPDAQVEAGVLLGQVLALCDAKERRVIVCMRSGHTALGDIARELGYANHSPVSKALSRIREKAAQILDVD